MDGNGRWAKERGLPRIAGHWAGAEALREVVKLCSQLNIKVLSVFAFSSENWKRPKAEVTTILNLLAYYFKKEVEELDERNVKIIVTGNWRELPERISKQIDYSIKRTKKNKGLILNVVFNYGARDEIVSACKNICKDLLKKRLRLEEIDEKLFSEYLYTQKLPDPDLVIRPSGELRISNFLLWQVAYSEFWFTKTYWPDFRPELLLAALRDFQQRDRRYGGINSQAGEKYEEESN